MTRTLDTIQRATPPVERPTYILTEQDRVRVLLLLGQTPESKEEGDK